ncbi:hypothetical protein TNCV_2761881 [Trichonephila clavipes]|nr:hypothetical protein TNCV_2761881 [Trichonephila clavipes]
MFCISGRNEWFSQKDLKKHFYLLQFSAHDSSSDLLGRDLVGDLGQLKQSKYPVPPYTLAITKPIPLLENCARITVMSPRKGLWVVIPTFGNLRYSCF